MGHSRRRVQSARQVARRVTTRRVVGCGPDEAGRGHVLFSDRVTHAGLLDPFKFS